MIIKPKDFHWDLEIRVRKKKGAQWQGPICGFYSTNITPEGYAIKSEREIGSVQIFPYAALELVPDGE